MSVQITPRSAEFVATVRDLDLRKPLSADLRRKIVAALDRFAVLFIPNQSLTLDELVEFTGQFGPLDSRLQVKLMSRVQSRLDNDRVSDISNLSSSGEVAGVTHRQTLMNVVNRFWHSDAAFARRPFRYSVLAAVSATSWGGRTEFADLRAAYDTLDERMKTLIDGRFATFYSHHVRQWLGIDDSREELEAYPPVSWPVVRTHPGSGRTTLWVDTKVTEISGLSVPEGRALVHELIEHITQPARVYSHCWQPDDVVMYDNRSVLHRGTRFDLAEKREMRRVSTLDDVEASP